MASIPTNELNMISGKHILVVDDEESIRFTVSEALKMIGCKVSIANDGLEAHGIIKELIISSNPVELLLTDIHLPRLTGLQLIKKLEKENTSLPILAMTAHGDKEMVIELLRMGCAEYIDKPFNVVDLIKRIALVFEKNEKNIKESEIKTVKLEEEKIKLSTQLEMYSQNFEALRKQVDSALITYYSIVHEIDKDALNVKVAYHFKPYSELGGDFVDVRNTSTGCDILVADVAGRDMGATYQAVMIKAFFDENCRLGNDGQTFFNLLNKQLIDNGKNDRMVTAVFMRIALDKMTCNVVSALHPPPIKVSKTRLYPEPLDVKGDILGIHEHASLDIKTFDLKKGDRFFFYTDGLIDACKVDGPTGKKTKLTMTGLSQLIEKYKGNSLESIVDYIWNDVFDFCRHKQRDDMLLLGVEIP